MEVLPLSRVWLEDKADLGFEIVYLAHLKHLGLKVPEGVVCYPPKKILNELLKQYSDEELFIHSRERLKKEWLQMSVPVDFVRICKDQTSITDQEIKKLWLEMLEGWFEQLSRAVVMKRASEKISWLGGYALFCGVSQKSGWMEVTGVGEPKIVANTGHLDAEDFTRLELIAKQINKAIPVSVKVWWLRDDELKVIRVNEIFFDQVSGIDVVSVGEKVVVQKEPVQILATKILLTGRETEVLADGWFRNIHDVNSVDAESAKVIAKSFGSNFVSIYRLGETNGGVLEWMQNMDLVRRDLHRIIELEELTDSAVQLCLPYCRSVIEYKTVREVLHRMKYMPKMYWVEIATPENLLNIDSYLELGVKGVVVNIDRLAHLLQGLDNEVSRAVVPDQTEVLDTIVSMGIKKLHRANCRVMIAGERIYDQELLNLAVKWGVWGVVTNHVNYEAVAQMLEKSENLMFKRLSATV